MTEPQQLEPGQTEIGQETIRRLRQFSQHLQAGEEILLTQSGVTHPWLVIPGLMWAMCLVVWIRDERDLLKLCLGTAVFTTLLWLITWVKVRNTSPELLRPRTLRASMIPGTRITKIIVDDERGVYKTVMVDEHGVVTSRVRTNPLPPAMRDAEE